MQQLVKGLAAQSKKNSERLEAKQKEVPEMEKLLQELASRNEIVHSRAHLFPVDTGVRRKFNSEWFDDEIVQI